MRHSFLFVLLPVILLAACGAVTAQTDIVPPPPTSEAGVRGSGLIPLAFGGAGAFDADVWRSGSTLGGGFRFTEISTNSRRWLLIVSKVITELTIEGNHALVRATGTWNGMPASLTIEAVDAPSGDWFRIVAVPQGPLTIIYERSGKVVRGDLVIYNTALPPDLHTKGYGMIPLANGNYGRFQFGADRIKGVIGGSLTYAELSAVATSAIGPQARISLPVVQRLTVSGNTATFGGLGSFNWTKAFIEVQVTDNSMLDSPVPIPDKFAIRATPAYPTLVPFVLYQASGPVLPGGDIFVGMGQ